VINLILWLLFGALVGWLASIVMRTDAQQGTILNIVVGIIGALIAGYIFPAIGITLGTGIMASIFHATIGAVILLALIRIIKQA
jgi:uncharacterized membrane protein YeaQ/YmgE (transglycosylase-associated protein family)